MDDIHRVEHTCRVWCGECLSLPVDKAVVTTTIRLRFNRATTILRYGLYPFWAVAMRSKQAVREAATICPAPCKLTFDLLALKVVSESRVTWATSLPILVFIGLCSRLRPDVRDRQTLDVRQTSDAHHRLMPPPYGTGHNK